MSASSVLGAPTATSRPTLRRGASGPSVALLQAGLNQSGSSGLAALGTDGIFGPKTEARVREFQRACMLATDGVVGPMTYAQLEPILIVLESMIDLTMPKPENIDKARREVVATAERLYRELGWSVIDPAHDLQAVSTSNPRILGKVAAEEAHLPGHFWRQGGQSLASIYRLARAYNPARCVTITSTQWKAYGSPGKNNNQMIPYPLSNNDIGSWCGIFCVAVFRLAGLKVQDWQLSKKGGLKIAGLLNGTGTTTADFRVLASNETPLPGDIGIEDATGLNHHFIIVEVNGDSCVTVEGNAGHNPNRNYSEIIRRGPGGVRGPRTISSFRRGSGNFFLSPVWGQLGVQ